MYKRFGEEEFGLVPDKSCVSPDNFKIFRKIILATVSRTDGPGKWDGISGVQVRRLLQETRPYQNLDGSRNVEEGE